MAHIIYADHAATTQLDTAALSAMMPYLTDLYGNPSAPYSAALAPKEALRQARQTIAACIGADADEIFFTGGGTESNNWAIKGTAFAGDFPAPIVTSAIEHHSVLAPCAALQRLGCSLTRLPATAEGIVTDTALEQHLPQGTKLVSVMLANNELGTVQPISSLAAIAHRHGALFHTDAVAAIGRMPLDVKALDVDLLSASAHKFGGPKGVGFLYIKRGTPIAPLLDGGAQENGLRAGTENVPAIVGMAAALQHRTTDIGAHRAHLSHLTAHFLEGLQAAGISFIRHGTEDTLPGLLSLAFPSIEAEALLHRLDLLGITVSAGAACNGTATTTSHVLQAIGLSEEEAASTIRVSFGYTNTKEDVSAFIAALQSILF